MMRGAMTAGSNRIRSTRRSRSFGWKYLVDSVGAAILSAALALGLVSALHTMLPQLTWNAGRWFVLALVLYGVMHVVRAFRLMVILSGEGLPMSRLASIHFYTSGSALFLPFKISDVFRLVEISRAIGRPVTGIIVVWVERVFDIVGVGLIFVLFALADPGWSTSRTLIFIWVFAATLTLIAFVALPPVLGLSIMHLIKRYSTPFSLRLVQIIHRVKTGLEQGPRMVHGPKLALVALVTGLIWLLEILAVGACATGLSLGSADFFSAFGARLDGSLQAALQNLSHVANGHEAGLSTDAIELLLRARMAIALGLGLVGIAGLVLALATYNSAHSRRSAVAARE